MVIQVIHYLNVEILPSAHYHTLSRGSHPRKKGPENNSGTVALILLWGMAAGKQARGSGQA